MERQHTHSPSLRSIAGTTLAGLGILVLFGSLDWAVAGLKNLFCGTAGEALRVLPCIMLSACRAMQAGVFDQHGLIECLLRVLLSFLPLFRVVGGAI